jgi:hypothetical protein
MKCDTTVTSSGIAQLAASIILAKGGHKVIVPEQRSKPRRLMQVRLYSLSFSQNSSLLGRKQELDIAQKITYN